MDAGACEFEDQLPDGRIVHVRRERLQGGMLISTYTDVTDSRRHEQHAALLATALGQSGDSVELADADYHLIYVNPAFTRLTGYTREEALGRTPAELLRSDRHEPEFFAAMHATLQRGEIWKGRLISRHKDGCLLYQDATISPVRDHEGRVAQYVAVKRDIGDQVRAAEALRASEARFRAIVEDQTELITRFSPDFTITFLNEAYGRHLGRPGRAVIGTSMLDLMNPEQHAQNKAQLARLSPESPVVAYEMRLPGPDGRIGWEQWTDRAIFGADGQVVEYQSVGRGISERKEAEEALRASEARFRTIIEDQTEFISRFTPDFVITFVNQAYARQLGRPRAAILGTSLLDLMTPEQRQIFLRQLAMLTRERPTISYEMEGTLEGGRGWEEWTDRALFDGQGRVVEYQSVGRDITLRKRAAAELRESEERFRAIAEGVPLPLAIARPREPEVLYANARARETFNLASGFVGDAVLRVWAEPEDRKRLARAVLEQGRVDGFEAQMQRIDGAPFWALISARLVSYGGGEAMLTAITDITERRRMEQAVRE
ncbi:MAG: PAS domain S-box protein, partial [Geminicoccaceae bacterium]